jgi:hypothetical protein
MIVFRQRITVVTDSSFHTSHHQRHAMILFVRSLPTKGVNSKFLESRERRGVEPRPVSATLVLCGEWVEFRDSERNFLKESLSGN